MTGALSSYLMGLGRLFEAIEIQNAAGAGLSLDEGAKEAVEMIAAARDSGAKVVVVGNGGSAAIASHTQNDLCKAVGMRSIVFTEQPLLTALCNDESYDSAYESLTKLWAAPGDLLLAISSSGKSENILRSAAAARAAGCRIITFSGFAPGNPLRSAGDVNFYVPSSEYGPVEVVHAALAQYLTDALLRSQEPCKP